ncbi:MAG: hypothetical protein BroJett002_37150 [Candidatus Brocadia sinica]|nr:MAG: hypothetical protein BroJett002_37150 [Candidatus Brocadia sinica]
MRYKSYSVLVFLVIFACIFSGCEEKRKALVTAHTAMGELLVSTKDQAKLLHTQKIIDDQTYQSIRTNWIRAQASYLTASDMLDHILSTDSQNITQYTELIMQVSTILSDIALWLEEDRDESTNDHITVNPTPTLNNKAGGGDTANSGVERVRQRSLEKSSEGGEGKSSGNDVGKLKVVSESEAMYNAHDEVQIYGITDRTAEVRIWVSEGSIVYTLDGSEPVLADGVQHLSISQSLTLDALQARNFKAKAGMSGTKVHVMILEKI